MDEGPEQIIIRVGERSFVFRPGEITARISRQVRAATGGIGILKALTALDSEPDLDILAAIFATPAIFVEIFDRFPSTLPAALFNRPNARSASFVSPRTMNFAGFAISSSAPEVSATL